MIPVVPAKTDVDASELDCTTDEVVNGTTRTCSIQGAYRFEPDCAVAEMLIELPSVNTFHGWSHIEGALVSMTKRSLGDRGVECPRSVFTMGHVQATPGSQDAGVPVLDSGPWQGGLPDTTPGIDTGVAALDSASTGT